LRIRDSRLWLSKWASTTGPQVPDRDDGWEDLYVTLYDNDDILYRNLGNGTFVDVTASTGIARGDYSNGAGWADIDNDGDLDLYVTTVDSLNSRRGYLYINQGDGTFVEDAVARGAEATTYNGQSVGFGDFNRDGWLDIMVDDWAFHENQAHSQLLKNDAGLFEAGLYADNTGYSPVNGPMIVNLPGVGDELNDKNRWQPLSLDFIIAQNGLPLAENTQSFLGSHWGGVTPFALTRPGPEFVYNDPGTPPQLGGTGDTEFKDAVLRVIRFSSYMDPDDEVEIDISPVANGNNTLGANDGTGHVLNPATGLVYEPQFVKRGDWGRILAEFWADGPSSETPPGHWNTLANYVSDHPLTEKRYMGAGQILEDLEWDVKLYFVLNGAVHDSAISAWDAKAKYDYVRPITAIRYMGGVGQSSDPDGLSYDPDGLPLEGGLVEVITADTTTVSGKHSHLAGYEGEIAIRAWLGNPADSENTYSGVGWIRAVEWVPYQRETFVTPPFAGYTSGHSTFSRAGAEVLTAFTGDAYFPGGMGTFTASANDFLEFEQGPSEDIVLEWATYYDASDEAGISRLYGGIHVDIDDLNGRIMGSLAGLGSWAEAQGYFDGSE